MTIIKFPVKLTDMELAETIVGLARKKAKARIQEHYSSEEPDFKKTLEAAYFSGTLIGWIDNLMQYAPDHVRQNIVDELSKDA